MWGQKQKITPHLYSPPFLRLPGGATQQPNPIGRRKEGKPIEMVHRDHLHGKREQEGGEVWLRGQMEDT